METVPIESKDVSILEHLPFSTIEIRGRRKHSLAVRREPPSQLAIAIHFVQQAFDAVFAQRVTSIYDRAEYRIHCAAVSGK